MLNLGFLFGISMAKNSNIIFASVDLYNSFWKFDEKCRNSSAFRLNQRVLHRLKNSRCAHK